VQPGQCFLQHPGNSLTGRSREEGECRILCCKEPSSCPGAWASKPRCVSVSECSALTLCSVSAQCSECPPYDSTLQSRSHTSSAHRPHYNPRAEVTEDCLLITECVLGLAVQVLEAHGGAAPGPRAGPGCKYEGQLIGSSLQDAGVPTGTPTAHPLTYPRLQSRAQLLGHCGVRGSEMTTVATGHRLWVWGLKGSIKTAQEAPGDVSEWPVVGSQGQSQGRVRGRAKGAESGAEPGAESGAEPGAESGRARGHRGSVGRRRAGSGACQWAGVRAAQLSQ